MITTVIFDLSEVYLYGLKGSTKHLGKKDNKVADSTILIEELDQLFLGKISEETYWQIVIEKNSMNFSIDELKKAVRKNFQEIKGTRKIIEKLGQNGYKLALLSNHAKEWIEYCEITYNYRELFHSILYSYEAKLSKPNKEIFMLILKKLKAKAEECLFIDDHIKNIQAAQELGFSTIQFTSSKNLKKELNLLKIKL